MSKADILMLVHEATKFSNKHGVPLSNDGFRRAADRGEIKFIKTAGGMRLFRQSDVEAFIAHRKEREAEASSPAA